MRAFRSVLVGWFVGLSAAIGVGGALAAPTVLDTSSPYYLGYYTPPEPSSATDEAGYINQLLATTLNTSDTVDGFTYVRSGISCAGCPTAVAADAIKDDTSPATTLDVSDWTYLIGKYDGQNAGGLVWYVADLTEISIPAAWGPGPQEYGLSHWTVFNPTGDRPPQEIPEPGTLALLGIGVMGAAIARRRRRL